MSGNVTSWEIERHKKSGIEVVTFSPDGFKEYEVTITPENVKEYICDYLNNVKVGKTIYARCLKNWYFFSNIVDELENNDAPRWHEFLKDWYSDRDENWERVA